MELALVVYIYACAHLGVAIFKFIGRWKEFDSFWPALGVMLLCLIVGELLIVWLVLIPLAVAVLLIYLKGLAMIDDWRRSRQQKDA